MIVILSIPISKMIQITTYTKSSKRQLNNPGIVAHPAAVPAPGKLRQKCKSFKVTISPILKKKKKACCNVNSNNWASPTH